MFIIAIDTHFMDSSTNYLPGIGIVHLLEIFSPKRHVDRVSVNWLLV